MMTPRVLKTLLIVVPAIAILLTSCLYESNITPANTNNARVELGRPSIYIEQVSTGVNIKEGTISTGDTIRFVLRAEVAQGAKIRTITATRQHIGFTGERVIAGYPKSIGFDSETSDTFSVSYVVNERVGSVRFMFAVADDSGNGKGSRTSYQNFSLRVLRNDSARNIIMVSQFDTTKGNAGDSYYNSYNELVSNANGAVANLTDISYGVINGKPFLISPAARPQFGLQTFQLATATKFDRTNLTFNGARARELAKAPTPQKDTVWIQKGGSYLFANSTKNWRGLVEVVNIVDSIQVRTRVTRTVPNSNPPRDTTFVETSFFKSPGLRATFNIKVQSDR